MAKTAVTFTVRIDGLRETLAAFRELPKDANQELRDRSRDLAEALAARAKAEGQSDGAQAALVARTVKAQRDRVPVVVAGGTRKLGRYRAPAFALLFGSEFGMNRRSGWYARPRFRRSTRRQYRPHQGRDGYWFFPTVEAEQGRISREWNAAADAIVRRFSEGG